MHHKLEKLMEKMGILIVNNPLKVILVVLLFLAFPIYHVPQIKMDTSTEGFMNKNDPILLQYNDFREQFGGDERIIVALKSDDIFTLKFLQTLRSMHEELEANLPYLDDITSLYNARNTRGVGETLVTDGLLMHFPKTQEQVEEIKKQALASHFYKDLFLSADGKMTTIIIETDAYSHIDESKTSETEVFEEGFESKSASGETKRAFLSDQENVELLKAVMQITNKYKKEGMEIYIAGSPLVNDVLKFQMQNGLQEFIQLTLLIIVVLLFVIFRRLSAVVYPVIVTGLSILATVGMMAWAGVPFKLPTQIVPSLLIAVSIGATVHVLSLFFDFFNQSAEKKDAIRETLKHSGIAIVMTSLTIAIGVGSFSGSEVAPISDLGTYAFWGVMVSLFLTLVLLPALLSITRLKPKKIAREDVLDRAMKKIATIPIRFYKIIITVTAVLVLISILTAVKMGLSHNPLLQFPTDTPERIATEVIDEKLNGSVTMELIIDNKQENGWNNPVRLEKLNTLSKELEKYVDDYTHVGKVVSLATIVKETNRALHDNQESHFTIPADADLVSQELLLFENSGSDDLEDVVDSQFSKARISIKLPWTDTVKATQVLAFTKELTSKMFPQESVVVTGMIPLLVNTFSKAVHSLVASYYKAFLGITLMMMFILGTVRLGLVSMIPNLVPILFGLLLMYVMDIPLDIFTLLIGSIAIGLAVDNTIHFMYHFKRYYLQSRDSSKAIEQAFASTGKAMVITSIVLSLGFYVYLFAEMISVQNFGLLTGSVIIFALFADLLLAPALMIVIAKRGWIR